MIATVTTRRLLHAQGDVVWIISNGDEFVCERLTEPSEAEADDLVLHHMRLKAAAEHDSGVK